MSLRPARPACPPRARRRRCAWRRCTPPFHAATWRAVGAGAGAQPVPPVQRPVLPGEFSVDDGRAQTWMRFRLLALQTAREAGTIRYEPAAGDMNHLCETVVLDHRAEHALEPARVAIRVSDGTAPFSTAGPLASALFEACRPGSARCIWEEF